jgi:hypothetical protein
MEEIKNKVKESGLIQLDLAQFKPDVELAGIDLASQLWQGLVLKEKDFREWVKENDWQIYENKAIHIYCSSDAILPTWAFMLVASKLEKSTFVITGSAIELEKELIKAKITELDTENFIDGRVIIKGCSDIHEPEYAMVTLVRHLQPVVKSIMYGEPCSTVPIYKR